ncbi:MAG: class I fructose-bisphosphate aldolase [Thiotrichales bacterium]
MERLLLDETKTLRKVRIAAIDAPERKQPFGQQAKRAMSDLVFGRDVVVESHKKDRWMRDVGRVTVDGVDVGLELVARGLDWHYKKYQGEQSPSDRSAYSSTESAVRSRRIGLWVHDQTLFASVQQAFDLGAVAVGATVYFGAPESRRQIQEVSEAFELAHQLGMVTVLWAYLRNAAFKHEGVDYHTAADLTGQANHLAATIGADIIKQKQAEGNGGYNAIKFGKTHPKVYSDLTSQHPIDLVRYQVANCYMGRIGMINSGGPSGTDDLHQAVRTAVINKRAGGMGLISGRKSFQKPMVEGIELLNAIQDVYLSEKVTVA